MLKTNLKFGKVREKNAIEEDLDIWKTEGKKSKHNIGIAQTWNLTFDDELGTVQPQLVS